MASFACIPANPEVSGIGVRLAIYIQILLRFIPAVDALRNGSVAQRELESVGDQSTTNFATAFAILIAAIIEAKTVGLSNFHGSIILSLSWMNNTNTFIYVLLYVQRMSQPAVEGRIPMDVSAWTRQLREGLLSKDLPKIGDLEEQMPVRPDPHRAKSTNGSKKSNEQIPVRPDRPRAESTNGSDKSNDFDLVNASLGFAHPSTQSTKGS
ncbi:hypothetical protein B0H11DRAFT_2335121, partial [Mycena galericulata]